MRILACLVKTFKENLREWKILVLVLFFAPFFVALMYAYFNGAGNPTYTVAVLNLDGVGRFSQELIGEWKGIAGADGTPALRIVPAQDIDAGATLLKEGRADILVSIPPDFTATFARFLEKRTGPVPSLSSRGDMTNPRSVVAASLCDYASFAWAGRRSGIEPPLTVSFDGATPERKLREFDLYVPPLMVLAIIMVLFTAAASLVREVEKGTIERLKLSRLRASEFMAAISLNQLVVGAACLALTFATALAMGYRTSGSLPLLLLVGLVTCLGVIAISMITACFIRTMFGLLTVGCFPFFILMFFSDSFMPLPRIDFFAVGGYQVYLNDVLPTAIASRAFSKVLNFNAGFAEIAPELVSISILALAYFAVGAWIFGRKHFRTR